MRTLSFLLCCLLAVNAVNFAYGYAVCGDDTKNDQVDKAVNEVVRRLMGYRSTDWGWESFSTATTLQVSAPKKFFGRAKTAAVLEDIIKWEWDYLNILDVAEFSFAAKALCLDPRKIGGKDLLEAIHDTMYEFLVNTSSVQPAHVIEYTLSLSALCINDYPIDKYLVEKLMDIQNMDGSFGPPAESVDATIWILRPMFCLTRVSFPSYNVTRVKQAVKKMRQFILKNIRKTPEGVFIGKDELMSNDALVGLYKSREPGEDPNTKWFCSDVMNTLGIHPLPTDDEYDLNDRLLRITATDFLDMQSKDYKCIETDPIPKDYKPTCNYEKPETCGMQIPK